MIVHALADTLDQSIPLLLHANSLYLCLAVRGMTALKTVEEQFANAANANLAETQHHGEDFECWEYGYLQVV